MFSRDESPAAVAATLAGAIINSCLICGVTSEEFDLGDVVSGKEGFFLASTARKVDFLHDQLPPLAVYFVADPFAAAIYAVRILIVHDVVLLCDELTEAYYQPNLTTELSPSNN